MAKMTDDVPRYYYKDHVLPFDEDMHHEFKGHTNVGKGGIPHWSDQSGSRSKISRALCSFLNTSEGGTVFIGVLDNGTVKGIPMTEGTKGHLRLTVQDVLSRYNPPVEPFRYTIKHVNVLQEHVDDPEKILLMEESVRLVPENQNRTHNLGSSKFCWCDEDELMLFHNGTVSPSYVTEITILPWEQVKDKSMYGVGRMAMHPVHENESGKVFFRRQAQCIPYSLYMVKDYVKSFVDEAYGKKIKELEEELKSLLME